MLDKLIEYAKDSKKQKYVFLTIGLVVLGVIFTYIPFGKNTPQVAVQNLQRTDTAKETLSYEEMLEKKLTTILQKMEGVGQVSVMLTTVSDEEKILAENRTQSTQGSNEQDQAGGTRKSESNSTNNQVVLQSGNTPYVITEVKPEVKGVLILAEGADNSVVKSELVEAVSRLLDVPVHKISVVKKQK